MSAPVALPSSGLVQRVVESRELPQLDPMALTDAGVSGGFQDFAFHVRQSAPRRLVCAIPSLAHGVRLSFDRLSCSSHHTRFADAVGIPSPPPHTHTHHHMVEVLLLFVASRLPPSFFVDQLDIAICATFPIVWRCSLWYHTRHLMEEWLSG